MGDGPLRLSHEEHDGTGATAALRSVLRTSSVVSRGDALEWRQQAVVDDGVAVLGVEAHGDVEMLVPQSPDLVVVAVRRGALRIAEGDRRVRLEQDDLGVVPTGCSARLSFSAVRADLYVIPAGPVGRALGVRAEDVRLHAPRLRPRTPALAAGFVRAARLLMDGMCAEAADGTARGGAGRSRAVDLLAAAAVDAFELDDRAGHGTDRDTAVLRRAIAFMGVHLRDPISVPDVAAAAGLSVRGLQLVFRRRLATSPLLHLRRLRLDAARQELAERAVDGTTVAEVAEQYGWRNHARFSAHYRAAFRESPAAAIRRIHAAVPPDPGLGAHPVPTGRATGEQ